ncbi:MAG: hypothetical protein HC837_21340 [Chloroflexaceae bacterium]|nr:hypothetical protein [Chloroflexaceae bacterium]
MWWTLAIGIVFAFLSYQQLYHTDLWGHVVYGQYIWNAGSIPQYEPLLTLSEGLPYLDTGKLYRAIAYYQLVNHLSLEAADDVAELVRELQRAELVVGYNVLAFDYKVLEAYTPLDLGQLPTCDLMADVEAGLGAACGFAGGLAGSPRGYVDPAIALLC